MDESSFFFKYLSMLNSQKTTIEDNFKQIEIILPQIISNRMEMEGATPQCKHYLILFINQLIENYSNFNMNLELLLDSVKSELNVNLHTTNPFRFETIGNSQSTTRFPGEKHCLEFNNNNEGMMLLPNLHTFIQFDELSLKDLNNTASMEVKDNIDQETNEKCCQELTHPEISTTTIDEIIITTSLNKWERQFPKQFTNISIIITECKNLTEFYATIVDNNNNNEHHLNDIFKLINSPQAISSYIPYNAIYPPHPGQLIIVQWQQYYFRAIYLQITLQMVNVFLIDVGKTIAVPLANCFHRKKQLFTYPPNIFKFNLEGCWQKIDANKNKVDEFIAQQFVSKLFRAYTLQSETEPIDIKLWNCQNVEMADALEQMNLIDRIEN